MKCKKVLLIIIPDYLSQILKKGEVVENYYNPGCLFEEVHILMTNDDSINPKDIQKMVGKARLHVHNLGRISFKKTFGWHPFLLKTWVHKTISLSKRIQPLLLRAHGNFINGYLAAQVKKSLNIPLVVSLHTNPDEEFRGRMPWLSSFKNRIYYEMQKKLEKETLKNADCVIPVYEPIRDYAVKYGARRVEVIYNIINPLHLRKKESYGLSSVPRIISVGRQFQEKNPDNLIRAVAETSANLTLVGGGEYHEYLKTVAAQCGAPERITFISSLSNDELCRKLAEYDIFAVHSEYGEISKSVLEAMLTGLPLILNRRRGQPVPELQGNRVLMVNNTKKEYREAIEHLLADDTYRESLGKKCFQYAWEHFAPDKMEKKVIALYKELVSCL